MRMSVNRAELATLVAKQIETLFLLWPGEREHLDHAIDATLARAEHCFAETDNKYYRKDDDVFFNPFHSGQYTIFLYFLSREIAHAEGADSLLADRVYYLNKALNGLDLYHQVRMPDVFMLDHPVGSVLGRADYGEYFRFSQGCTVGNNRGIYPVIGRRVTLLSGATIVGASRIGDDVIVAANTFIKDTDVPDAALVFGASPDLTIKPRRDR
jgi:serine O-acetyltransferase